MNTDVCKKCKWMEYCLYCSLHSCCGKLPLPLFGSAALLTVSEEVRSRCSLKHRKSLLLTDVSMENVPMDTYPIHHSDTSYRWVVSLLGELPTLQSLYPLVSDLWYAGNWTPLMALSPWAVMSSLLLTLGSGVTEKFGCRICTDLIFRA